MVAKEMRGCINPADPTVVFPCRYCPEKYGSAGCKMLRTIGNTKVVDGLREIGE